MGRKKRKVEVETETVPEAGRPPPDLKLAPPPPPPPLQASGAPVKVEPPAVIEESSENGSKDAKPSSSGYAMTTHSAEIIDEDIYISDGSDDEDLTEVEMVLAGSRMGIMRRGIHHPMLVQPNRQWVREDQKQEGGEGEGEDEDEEAEQKRLKEQEEELAKLDPAQRAARLLVEKQKKLEEAKVTARRLESEENAGRDPCLFSKRTAFDIRFDQIDDKPWMRGQGDLTDYFNYGLQEEDWMDYAEQQLAIRQELTDASRQRRPPDPTVVTVTPRAPTKQTPKVAVAVSATDEKDADAADAGSDSGAVIGPVLVKQEIDTQPQVKSEGPDKKAEKKFKDVPVTGGAWGAGAAPGSMLAKLIEDQERKAEGGSDVQMSEAPRGHAMEADSKYGPASGHDGSQDNRGWNQNSQNDHDWNNHGHQSHQSHQDWNNQSHGGQQDWNNRGSYGQQQDWNQQSHSYRGGGGGGGGGGGRGYYGGGRDGGGRGGRGGGRGGYNDHGGRGRDRDRDRSHQSSSYRGGGGDYHQRKRPRDEYDDRSWRR
jgi:hypothetical protein